MAFLDPDEMAAVERERERLALRDEAAIVRRLMENADAARSDEQAHDDQHDA